MNNDQNNFQGHINFHFLVRLLEVIVRTSKLDHYYVDFDGIDKGRAQVLTL